MDIMRGAPTAWRAAAQAAPAVVAIGNFDGVHCGHRALIARAIEQARSRGVDAAVLTFEPHPRSVFQSDGAPFRLSPEPLKARRIAELGADKLYVATFDQSLSSLSAEAFAQDVLRAALGAVHVVTGRDFRFGAKRAGDAALLTALGLEHGFTAEAIAPVAQDGVVFSSTAARAALRSGRPEEAARILGGWHRVEGRVEKGHQRGRDLGFPTANLNFGDAIRPAFGVYAVGVEVCDGPHAGVYDGVASIGVRPTFDGSAENFEVFIFDFAGDLYGSYISAELRHFLRPELKFDDVDALILQMRRDVEEARAALAQSEAPWR